VYALPLLAVTLAQFVFVRAVRGETLLAANERNHLQRAAMRCFLVIPLTAFFIALAASPKSELMLSRCIASVAPLLLLALSAWLGKQRARSAALIAAVTVVVFIVSYVVALDKLLATSRSNARELGETIARRTASSDLVVISPDWIASSFNRYYIPQVEQIDFPEFRREGAVDFARYLDRFRSEEPLTHAHARFVQAHAEGRRIWLVIESRKIRNFSPDMLQTMLNSDSYGLLATARTAQLRLALDSVYGSPDTLVVSTAPTQRYEFLQALLYSRK
jgi:hypothetical protein